MKIPSLIVVLALLRAGEAGAASLQVTPVFLEVGAPGATTSVTLRNKGARPIATQVRIFRWMQEGGQERLEPTTDVVASPPAVELRPEQDYLVRVVRTTKRPVEGEEAYRLFIDELPEAPRRSRAVSFVVRHAIPLLFDAPDGAAPDVAWRVTQAAQGVSLTAVNGGDRRFRLAAVKISDAGGKTVSFGPGLVGYVLGHATMTWTLPAKSALRPGAKVTISGQSEEGSFNAQAAVQSTQ